jgi:uncharacterized protein (TIGR02118 family)
MQLKLFLCLILLTTAFAGFGQATQPGQNDKQNAAATDKGLIKISVMYPFAEGKTFNMDYYQAKHMPMVAGYIGSNLVKYTIEKGVASGIPNQPMAYMAIGIFYVKSLSEYQAAIAPNRDAIRADFPNYTNVTPVILVSEVVR